MALTWLTKTKQYFTTKVFTEDRFRTGDKPTEAEYSNLFQSIVFKVHDLATGLLAGIVRKATKLDFLLGKDTKPTTISGYTHEEPLYVNPPLMQEFILPAGSITSWIPFRAFNRITGQIFADNAGTILDTGFLGIGVGTTIPSIANADWYSTGVIDYFEKNYLSNRYRICDGRTITFVNPYTNLNETIVLPNLIGRVVRGGSTLLDTTFQQNQGLFDYGGYDVQDLSHIHRITKINIETNISVFPTDIVLTVSNLPPHAHLYNYKIVSTTSALANLSVGGSNYITGVNATDSPTYTSSVGNADPFTHSHNIVANDIYTEIETPSDPSLPDFREIDNRQRFFNTYFIIAIY